MIICSHVVHGFFWSLKAELSSCDKDHMACKAFSVFYLDFTKKVCQPLIQEMPGLYFSPTEIRISGGKSQAGVLSKASQVVQVCGQGCKPLVQPVQPL